MLDGAYHDDGDRLAWNELGHLQTREVGEVLENAVRRMARYLRRHGLIELGRTEDEPEPEAALAASAVSGREPRHTSSHRNGSVPDRDTESAME